MSARPGIRWWWAAPLDLDEAVRELGAIASVGFGEVEIAFSPDAWATAHQRRVLRAVLDEAVELGVVVSMTMGASWPVRTPNTGAGSGLAARELQYGRVDLPDPGRAWSGPAPEPFDVTECAQPRTLVAVVAARVLRDGPRPELLPAADRPRWGSPVRVPASSTVLDPGSLQVVPGATAERVRWAPPRAGHWILVGLWSRDNAEHNTNPFDADAARAATSYLDEHQLGPEGLAALAAGDFFEDSLELNAQSVSWTAAMPEEFAERRGYDLTPFLPLLFAHGMSNYWVPHTAPTPDFDLPGRAGDAVRRDFHRTLTDLYVDRHLATYQEWSRQRGRTFKAQVSYGQNLEPVRSARELARLGGRVETESLNSGDRAPVRMSHPTWRFALDHQRCLVSGVHQAGLTRVSTELGAQFLATYELGLGDYKDLMDKAWSVGVTRPYVHGFAFDPPGTEWPGRQRFGDFTSESWNDRHFPQWPRWTDLTAYWARGTQLLERGTAKADVAIHRDGFLTSTARGFSTPDTEGLSPPYLFDAAGLERQGYVVEFVDPVLLEEQASGCRGELLSGSVGYRAVVVDERDLPAPTSIVLADAVARGLHLVLVGEPPRTDGQAGKAALAQVLQSERVCVVATAADVAGALRRMGIAPRVDTHDHHLLVQVRDTADARVVLLYNPADSVLRTTVTVEGAGVPYVHDLWAGRRHRCGRYRSTETGTTVPVVVPARGCTLVELALGDAEVLHVLGGPAVDVRAEDGGLVVRATEPGTHELELSDGSRRTVVARPASRVTASLGPYSWRVVVDAAGPSASTLVVDELPVLADWRAVAELAAAGGTATYTGRFTVPEEWLGEGRGVLLDLGHVAGTAEVAINAHPVGVQVVDGRSFDVSAAVVAGDNELSVVVRTVIRNAVSHHRRTSARTTEVGLRGPVAFTPYVDVSLETSPAAPPDPRTDVSP